MAHEKLKEALHYVIARCDDPARLGAIRLNKILWFADREAYRMNGSSITADTYVKRKLGPTPKNVLTAISELATEEKIAVREATLPSNYVIRQFFTLAEPEGTALSDQDRAVLDGFTRIVCDNFTANEISSVTHDHIWDAAEMGEEIPLYAAAFAVPGQITAEVRAWASEALQPVLA